jgi:branched-chain amino acid transport system substrate-binding protein
MAKNRIKIVFFFLTFVLATGLLLGFGSSASAKDEIRIGFSMALTGRNAPAAAGQMQAYQLWEEVTNKKGGIHVKEFGKKLPVKFVYYDDKSDASTSVKVYEKLIVEDKVDLVFSPQSTTNHFAVAPLADRYKVPIVGTTAASVKLRDIKTNYFWFITAAMPDRQMRALVDLLKHLGVKSVAIIYAQELFPRENLQFLEPYVKEAGFKVVLKKDYAVGAKDLTTLLSDVKGKNPDAVIGLCYPGGSFTMTTQAQEVGLNPNFFFQLIGPATVVFQPKFGAAAEGLTTIGHWSPKGKWPGAKEFYDAFLAKYSKKPDYLNSVLAYSGCQIVEQAVEKVGNLDWQKLRDYIATNEFQTINGPVKFTGSENLKMPSMIMQWVNGELEIVWPKETATASPKYPKPKWPK